MTAARNAPAAARNREPIAHILREWLPQPGRVLEIASGTGEHATWFTGAMPNVTWQPTDQDPEALASIAAWRETTGYKNLLPPLQMDATAPETWPNTPVDAVVSINMIHIAPWAATLGLMQGAANILPPAGLLFLYGPFREAGAHTAPTNADFDASLRARNPAWGVRDREAVAALAATHALSLAARIPMPANNLTLIFRKA